MRRSPSTAPSPAISRSPPPVRRRPTPVPSRSTARRRWSATTSNAYLCGRPQTTVLVETCGSERELIDTNNAGTAEYIYVFDSAGKLFAISYSVGGSVHCVAGPQEFVAPVGCGAPALFSCATDGGHKGGLATPAGSARRRVDLGDGRHRARLLRLNERHQRHVFPGELGGLPQGEDHLRDAAGR